MKLYMHFDRYLFAVQTNKIESTLSMKNITKVEGHIMQYVKFIIV